MTRYEILTSSAAPARGPVPPVLCLCAEVPLSGRFVKRLIAAEQAGAHLILLATSPGELMSPIAALARLVVTEDEPTVTEATASYGAERVIRADPHNVASWIARLPTPEAMTTRRRVRRALRRVPGATSLHSRFARRQQ